MINFIYITTNLITGKQYVGSHKGLLTDLYLGSGLYLKKAVKKYGKENFKREIIEECDPSLNLILETKYIKEYNTLTPIGYNISPTGGQGLNSCLNEVTKEKIKNSLLGVKHTKERKENISKASMGRIYSKERCEKQRQSMLGKNKNKKMSDETKGKLSSVNKGKTHSDDTKKKQSISHLGILKGHKHTEEFKEKRRKIQTGKKLSKETKEKQSLALKKYWENKRLNMF